MEIQDNENAGTLFIAKALCYKTVYGTVLLTLVIVTCSILGFEEKQFKTSCAITLMSSS